MGALFQAQAVLEDFDPKKDYLLWPNSGDPAAIIAIMIALSLKGVSRISFLNWERRMVKGIRNRSEGFYTPVIFQIPSYNE
jgi:hypothetical protein